jgi:hypothetical protein
MRAGFHLALTLQNITRRGGRGDKKINFFLGGLAKQKFFTNPEIQIAPSIFSSASFRMPRRLGCCQLHLEGPMRRFAQ